jgi:hypothetical protein
MIDTGLQGKGSFSWPQIKPAGSPGRYFSLAVVIE